MPLTKSSSKAALKHNIAEMIRAGHDQKQAEAAAYSNQRRVAGIHRHMTSGLDREDLADSSHEMDQDRPKL